MTRLRADVSAIASPEDTMSAPSRPKTVKTAFRLPVLAALTRASTASCAVLKDCWAFATGAIANASSAAVNEASLARDEMGLVNERIVIMGSSFASESRIQLMPSPRRPPQAALQASQYRIRVMVGSFAPDAIHCS